MIDIQTIIILPRPVVDKWSWNKITNSQDTVNSSIDNGQNKFKNRLELMTINEMGLVSKQPHFQTFGTNYFFVYNYA